ncbi:MAG: TolC family protein, partial [Candidatus Acidiferrum sp.]
YIYAWKQLVATIGLRQLPLSEVAGRVDRLIPAFDYDTVLAHVLRNHTDVLSARNAIEKAKYNLKLAQVTPIPDVDVHVEAAKETTLPPFTWYTGVQVGVQIPVWDQNKGQIIAAQAALERAMEEPHRVETNLTNNLATSFLNYKNNLEALEYYRRHILPDQVRAYRGVYARRRIDPNAAFGDLVQAQQTLASNVSTYLGLLGQLWTSAVTVADLLQTDDLFQMGQPLELPALPDLDHLPAWPCPHPAQDAAVKCECPIAQTSGTLPRIRVIIDQTPHPVRETASSPMQSVAGKPSIKPVPKPFAPAPPADITTDLLLVPPPPVVRPPATTGH